VPHPPHQAEAARRLHIEEDDFGLGRGDAVDALLVRGVGPRGVDSVAAQDLLKPFAVKTKLGEDLDPDRGPLRRIPTCIGLGG
jgi:hypothetical protein